MSAVTDYGGIPYAQGSLFGVRAFRVDALGRLVASTRNEVWEPGENIARHGSYDHGEPVKVHRQIPGPMAKDADDAIRALGATGKPDVTATRTQETVMSWQSSRPTRTIDVWHVTWMDHGHSPAVCDSCGFHGFTEPDAKDYEHYDRSVVGVIEGYGKLTHGTRGFRAEKAKVVALLDPTPTEKGKDTRGWFARTMWWLARHPGARLLWATLAFLLLVGNMFAKTADLISAEAAAVVAITLTTLLTANVLFPLIPPWRVVERWGPPGAEWRPGRRQAYHEPSDDLPPGERVHVELAQAELVERFELVKRNYPDVQIFTDREEMTKAFGVAPVPPPPPPSPTTTDGFWELPVEGLRS